MSEKELYLEKYITNDDSIFSSMEVFYSLIDSAKQSVFQSFVKTDMSKEALKDCIKKEAIFLDKIHDTYKVSLKKENVIGSLKPMYKSLKRSMRKNNDKPTFFHVNRLKETLNKERHVTFESPSFSFDNQGNFVLGDALTLSMPVLSEVIKETENENNCKVKKMTFIEVGEAVYEDTPYSNVTLVEIYYQGN